MNTTIKRLKRSDMIKLNKHITRRIFNQFTVLDKTEEVTANFNKLEDDQKQVINKGIDRLTDIDKKPTLGVQNVKILMVLEEAKYA